MTYTGKYLQILSPLPSTQTNMPCVVLAHNEALILPEFLRHYRDIGVDRFFIVDDRSTDGSLDFLRAQPDVTIFTPVEGSTYRTDKRFWRAELLDTYCSGKWVVVPDVDEHLVYRGMEDGRDLSALIRSMKDEGAEAMHATMLDMYCDKPLRDHRYEGGRLIDDFPLFDGPDHYFRMAVSWRTGLEMQTPTAFAFGGMRQRLFETLPILPDSWRYRLLRRYCDIAGNFDTRGLDNLTLLWVRLRLRRMLHSFQIYNCSKLVLLIWRKGMMFSGGAHAVSERLLLSRQRAVILHFKFAAGTDGLEYIAQRGQHAGGSELYKRLLRQTQIVSATPVFEGTRNYASSASLGRLLN
ncbi:MAG: glycosyltransferase family 2 protein [Pseudomonadota bacterium]